MFRGKRYATSAGKLAKDLTSVWYPAYKMEVRMERNARTEHAPFSLSPVAACIPWKAVRSRETPRWKQRRLVTELFDDSLNGIASARPETNGNEQG